MRTTIMMIFVRLNGLRDLKEFLTHVTHKGRDTFALRIVYKLLFNFEIADVE